MNKFNRYPEFKDKVVLVTGAASGIGEAVVSELRAHCRCWQWDLSFGEPSAYRQPVNIAEPVEVERAFQKLLATEKHIDYLVHCAGKFSAQPLLGSDNPVEEFSQLWQANTLGTLNVTSIVGRQMKQQRQGSMVVVSSNAASTPRTNMGFYGASKAAASYLTRVLALELAPFGVRCNLVSPGSTLTNMQRQFWQSLGGTSQDLENEFIERVIEGDLSQHRLGIPLNKMAQPKDIADTILFLLSDSAGHITLENIVVDGGATLGFG